MTLSQFRLALAWILAGCSGCLGATRSRLGGIYNLAGADLTGANLAGANLARANLTGANLAGANLAGAVPHFFADDRDALADIRRCAAEDPIST